MWDRETGLNNRLVAYILEGAQENIWQKWKKRVTRTLKDAFIMSGGKNLFRSTLILSWYSLDNDWNICERCYFFLVIRFLSPATQMWNKIKAGASLTFRNICRLSNSEFYSHRLLCIILWFEDWHLFVARNMNFRAKA